MADETPTVEASPDSPLPGLIVERALSGVFALERQLERLRRRYRDRHDLLGIQLAIRGLDITTQAMKRYLIESARGLEPPYEPDPDYRPDPFKVTDEDEAEETYFTVPLDARVTTEIMREFEAQFRYWAEWLASPQGRAFDSLAGPFARLAKTIPADKNLELIFYPSPARQYGIVPDVTRVIARIASTLDLDLDPVFDEMPTLSVIEYPLLHEADTFQHACIAHEVAHIAFDERSHGDHAWLDAALEHLGEEADINQLAFGGWFKELACDLLAVRMLGPAYGLAFNGWVVAQNTWFHDEASGGYDSHPDAPWRLARLQAEVDRFLEPVGDQGKHRETWAAVREVVGRWKRLIPQRPRPEVEELAIIETALENVAARASEILGHAEYTPARFAADIGPVWAKLKDRMAPAEAIYERSEATRPPDAEGARAWSEPIDWRSILNGGYLHYLHKNPAGKPAQLLSEAEERHKTRLRAAAHIQGSIELSELHRTMHELRSQLAGIDHID